MRRSADRPYSRAAWFGIQVAFWVTFIAAMFLLFPAYASAASVRLAWDLPGNDARITGYEVQYGTTAGTYTKSLSVVGAKTGEATVDGLDVGQTYYFSVRSATSDPSLFSANSNEVSARIGPDAPSRLRVVVTVLVQ